MSYNNQLRLKVNVSEFVKQIWWSGNLVSYDMAVVAPRFCTLQGRHGVQYAVRIAQGLSFLVYSKA